MDEEMTTTAFTLDGYRVVESLGVVRGVTVRSRSLLGTIGAKFETLIGGHITMLTSLCERARAAGVAMEASYHDGLCQAKPRCWPRASPARRRLDLHLG